MKKGRLYVFLVLLGIFCLTFHAQSLLAADDDYYDDETEEYYAKDDENVAIYQKTGPVPMRNEMPLYLFYLQLRPDTPEVVKRGKFKVDAAYTVSNITVSAFTPMANPMMDPPTYEVDIDCEVSRFDLDFRYGIYDNMELFFELPLVSLSSGYLDSFVEGFEEGIGARTPRSRTRQGTDNFDYRFKYDGNYLINTQDGSGGIGDLVLGAKYKLLNEGESLWRPNFAVRGAVKFPTGSDSDLLGSGKFDFGFGALADKAFFNKRLFIYVGGSMMIIQEPDFFSAMNIHQTLYSGLLAFEYFFAQRFSGTLQFMANSSPYPDDESKVNPLKNEGYDFGLVTNYRFKRKPEIVWRFACFENISAASSPDVSFHTAIEWDF